MDYLEIAAYIGTIAFAINGIIISIRKDLDIMGAFILSFLTCSGGGILRDILLNRTPIIFHNSVVYLVIIVAMIIFKLLRQTHLIDRLEGTFAFRMSDTVGLAAFAISGGQTAILLNHSFFTVVIITFLTAVGGGIIRDTLVNDVPQILKSGFYGSVAVLIGIALYLCHRLHFPEAIALPCVFTAGIVVRSLAIYYRIQLSKI